MQLQNNLLISTLLAKLVNSHCREKKDNVPVYESVSSTRTIYNHLINRTLSIHQAIFLFAT